MKKHFAVAAICSGCLALLGVGFAHAQNDAASDLAPLGFWLWSAEERSDLRAMSLKTLDGSWVAKVDGSTLAATHSEGEISFNLADGQAFRGELSRDKSEIRGYWFQPPSQLDYQFVATPVVLSAKGADIWQAEITVQARPYRVFLDVFAGEGEAISAIVRNPSGNNTMRASRFRIEAEPMGGWSLVSGQGERERRHRISRNESGGLELVYDRFEEPITLSRASETDRRGYASRPGENSTALYTPPPKLNDGWRVTTPEKAGFERATLNALTQKIASLDPRTEPHLIHSLLVSHKGALVYEEYFYGQDRERRHDVRSLGKVFGSVMIGALQNQGHDITADHRPVADVLREAGLPLDDEQKADITLGDLMTYTSGLDCDVNAGQSAGNEENMWAQDKELNYWLYTAKLAMLHDPGRRYAYCSGSANLVGASLSQFGKAQVHELFDDLIAKPLGFGPYHWALAPNGEGYLGGGAYIRPRDVLKVGAMYAAGGVWNGRQIVSADWIEESTTPRLEINPHTTGMTPQDFQDNYFGGSQAYIWAVNTIEVGERRYTSYQASGNGGQLLIVVPELDLVVGMTGGNYRMGGIWGRWRDQIVGGYIIPAMGNQP